MTLKMSSNEPADGVRLLRGPAYQLGFTTNLVQLPVWRNQDLVESQNTF